MLKQFFLAAIFSVVASFASACETTRIDCIPKPAPGVNFVGTQHHTDYQPLLVCHPWWSQLRGSPARGTRWWGPTKGYARTGWEADLAPVHQACKWFWLRPGEHIETDVSCLNWETVRTPRMTKAMAGQKVDLARMK